MSDHYRDKLILAPMVRAGTLPLRVLALAEGADIVYSEEIVDHRIEQATRVENALLGTVDFVVDQDVVFRTCPAAERDQVVFQVGTNSPERALAVARLVFVRRLCLRLADPEHDVSGFDVNMGCPKSFSLSGGMGAALLGQPDLVSSILSTLVDARLRVPVTCKIRVLDNLEDTLALCQLIERTGVAAVAIHGRTKHERPQHTNRVDYIRECARAISIPVIAKSVGGCGSGMYTYRKKIIYGGGSADITCRADIEAFRLATGCSSVMVGRAAQLDARVFSPEFDPKTQPDKTPLMKRYLQLCVDYGNDFSNTKYMITRMMGGLQASTAAGRAVVKASTLDEIMSAFDQPELRKTAAKRSIDDLAEEDGCYTMKLHLPTKRLKRQVPRSPKCTLLEWCKREHKPQPQYKTVRPVIGSTSAYQSDFRTAKVAIETFRRRHSNVRLAEQAAALVALYGLNIRHLLTGQWEDD